MAKNQPVAYENNPFMIGIEGLKLIFTNAKSVGIYSIVLTVSMILIVAIWYFVMLLISLADGSMTIGATGTTSAPESVAAAIGLLISTVVYLVVTLFLFGPLEHSAAMTAQGKQVTIGESFKAVVAVFPAYLWMYLIFTVKVLLWSLLFIIPGIIMYNRYILSGTVFFAEGKRGNAAIKRSAELTKDGWLTTYGGTWVWNFVSQGIAAFVFWPGCMAVLYRQFASLDGAKQAKPPAHILSWLTLLVPIGLALLYVMFMALLFALIAQMPTS